MVSRKRIILSACMSLILLVSVLGVGCPAPPEEEVVEPVEVIEWKLDSWCVPGVFLVPEIELACERISQRLDGRFMITPVWGAALGVSAFESLPAVSKGVFPLAFHPISYWAADMPVLGVLGLPGLSYNLWEHNLAKNYLTELFVEEFDKEWGVKLIGELSAFPPSLFFSKEPIREIEDFKGVTIRGYSPEIATVVDALGGVPITMPWAEVYIAAERGLMEGIVTSVAGCVAISLWEIWDYATDIPFVPSDTALIVNNDAFEKLPAEYKYVFMEEFTAMNTRLSYRAIQTIEESWAVIEGHGMTRITPGPELMIEIAKISNPLWDAWAEERGELVVKALADARELLEGVR